MAEFFLINTEKICKLPHKCGRQLLRNCGFFLSQKLLNKPPVLTGSKTQRFFDNNRAQVWSLDAIVGMIIFTAAMVVLFFYAMNYINQSEINMEDLSYQGNIAAEFILSEEHGILTSNKIDQIKLDEFYYSDYEKKKGELGVKDDFYFNIPDLEINGSAVDYVGKMNGTAVKNLIQVTRFSIYKNKPVQFNIFIWG